MSLRKKTMIVVGTAFLVLMAAIIVTSRIVVLKGFVELESNDIQLNVRRGMSEISNVLSRLNALAGDWAHWDETYVFIEDLNEDYIRGNLNVESLSNLEVNFMLFFNQSGKYVFGKFIDLIKGIEIPVPADLLGEIVSSKALIEHTHTESSKTGVVMVGAIPVLVASRPILKSDLTGPIRGSFILGRYLDPAEIERLCKITHLSLTVHPFKDAQDLPGLKEAHSSLSENAPVVLRPQDSEFIEAYAVHDDIHGEPGFILKVQMPRKIYQHGRTTLIYYISSLLAIGLFFIVLIMMFLAKAVLSPLSKLSREVSEIGKSGNLSKQLSVSRKDELGSLAGEINGMLKELEKKTGELERANHDLTRDNIERKKAEKALQESERRLRRQNNTLLELARDKILYGGDLKAALVVITEAAAKTLEVERAAVWLYSKDRSQIRFMDLYEMRSNRHSEGAELASSDYPSYFKAMESERTIAASDAHADPRTREFIKSYLTPMDITSLLHAPIWVAGKMVGTVCHEHVGAKRQWKTEEENFAGSIADFAALALETSERKRTEEKNNRLEAQLQRSQKMEAIGMLAGGVAHDLNNILGGIVSYPELLLMEIQEDSPLRKPILTIKKSGEKAATIVNDLLTLARRGVAATEVVNLNSIISDYLDSPELENLKSFHPDVLIETRLERDLLNIMGSPVHLSKTVMNLVSNAAEAMPEGGKIQIFTENRYVDRPITGYDSVDEGDYAIFTVSDSGIGISSEEKERIFEPFYTKKVMGRSGTGLGMAVVWGTVKDHNGYIDLHSVEGKGTLFTLYFPVTRQKLVEGNSQLSIEEYCGSGESILIVDDVQEQREVSSRMLEKLGYSVTSVSSGEKAIEYMKSNSADLIVLDMIMDPGMDGLDTYRKIIELHPGQRAIITSGFSESERIKEAQRLGAGAYLKKPILLEKFGLAVRYEFDKER